MAWRAQDRRCTSLSVLSSISEGMGDREGPGGRVSQRWRPPTSLGLPARLHHLSLQQGLPVPGPSQETEAPHPTGHELRKPEFMSEDVGQGLESARFVLDGLLSYS